MNITYDIKVKLVEQPTKSCKKANKKLNQQILNDIKRSNKNARFNNRSARGKLM